MNLYLTADKVGQPTGGGQVTFHERQALQEAFLDSPVMTISIDHNVQYPDPFAQDTHMLDQVKTLIATTKQTPRIAHCYAGCLGRTVSYLRSLGTIVSYTVAAHDVDISRREHERLGLPFEYPHLNDPTKFKEYIRGYIEADVVVVPGQAPLDIVRRQGREGRIVSIPHGHNPPLPEKIQPLPSMFTVGYMGAYGPDKGIRYLLEAWKALDYNDATLLLAGRDSGTQYVRDMITRFGGGNVSLMGWVEDVSDFYNRCSLYVQPSATEGFGIEVLEAMAHGRPVICSTGAGAADLVDRCYDPPGDVVKSCSGRNIAEAIDEFRTWNKEWNEQVAKSVWESCQDVAGDHTWENIRLRYAEFFRGLLT